MGSDRVLGEQLTISRPHGWQIDVSNKKKIHGNIAECEL